MQGASAARNRATTSAGGRRHTATAGSEYTRAASIACASTRACYTPRAGPSSRTSGADQRPLSPAADRAPSRPPRFLHALFSRPLLPIGMFSTVSLAAAAIFALRLPRAMERNLENLSNDLQGVAKLRRDHARAQASLGKSIAGSVALLESSDEAAQFCAENRKRMQEPRYASLIDGCETVASVVPDRPQEKLALLREIASLLPDRVLAHADAALRERLASIRTDLTGAASTHHGRGACVAARSLSRARRLRRPARRDHRSWRREARARSEPAGVRRRRPRRSRERPHGRQAART
jgi:hypothetical protein